MFIRTMWICIILGGIVMPGMASIKSKLENTQIILDTLYRKAGQFDNPKPRVRLSSENKKVAAYYPAKNEIILDELVYDICIGMGRDSTAALAYILAHELAHSFQSEIIETQLPTNFLSYDRTFPEHVRIEKVADIQGAFNVYLAGWNLEGVLNRLLPEIYEAYDLIDVHVIGYPPLQERIETASEVTAQVDLLIDLFEASSYLILEGQHRLAAVNYQYILQYYQGCEVHNDLGILFLKAAQDYYNAEIDKFIHPFQLDVTSHLEKIEKSRGDDVMDEFAQNKRRQLLQRALKQFDIALKLNQGYSAALLNKASCLNLLGKADEALKVLESAESSQLNSKSNGYENIVRGIAFALNSDMKNANFYFQLATESKDRVESEMANLNIDVLQNQDYVVIENEEFVLPQIFIQTVSQIQMPRMSAIDKTYLNEKLFIKRVQQGQSKVLSFGDDYGNIVTLIIYTNPIYSKLQLFDEATTPSRQLYANIIPTPSGYLLGDKSNNIALELTSNGQIDGVVKFIFHRDGI